MFSPLLIPVSHMVSAVDLRVYLARRASECVQQK